MNKLQIIDDLSQVLAKVEQGEAKALDVFPDFYEVERSIKEMMTELKNYAIEERSAYSDKDQVIKGGYELSVRSMTRHSYTADEHWQSIKQTLSNREALMKKAYAMSLKGQTLTDMDTGEVITPSVASTSTSIVAKFVGE